MQNKSKYFLLLLTAVLMAFQTMNVKKKITIFMAGDSTMSIKETKAYPETGWGMPFSYFFDSSVSIVNKAKNGRSTKTFISEGLWQSIISNVREGDYVIIQFGHNDESKEKTERYTTPDEYKTNLIKFITETREKKAIPILFTPVSRRKFDKANNTIPTHEAYSALVREVAKTTGVLFVDLDERSRQLYQNMGMENSRLLFLQLKPGEHPNYPDGKEDNTHFNELGARLIAQLVLSELKNLHIELTERLVKPIAKK
ncbi:MAG: rhamnogalacturonan acetylesterase [Ferruginibacter sp.]